MKTLRKTRIGHHRVANRPGPWESWRRRVAFRLVLLFAAVRSLDELLAYDWPDAPVAWKAARLKARQRRDDAWPLLCDQDGSGWE